MKKLSYEEVKTYIESLGYLLLSNKYNRTQENLILQDKNMYLYFCKLGNLKSGKIPRLVDKTNPYSIENINLWCELNGKNFILISNIYDGNNKNLKWKCLKENCGEEFYSTWGSIISGCGCPFCSNHQVSFSKCLAIKNQLVASEWHPTKNGNLTPYDVLLNSNKKVWWQCSKNSKHEWKVAISDRNRRGCPYCSGRLPTEENNFLIINPRLSEEWDYERNKKRPEEYTQRSSQKVWWKCSQNPKHIWESTISNRCAGNGCPYCSGKLSSEDYNLAVCHPELINEWDYNKNDKNPESYTSGSGQYVWWKCKECGYEWNSRINHRTYMKSGCPSCNESKGEKKIKEICKLNNIPHDSQYIFDDLLGLGGGLLKFDVPIFWDEEKTQLRMLIEFDGEQHFKWVKGMMTKKEFEILQYHDKLKDKYCNKNNIKLLRIKFDQFDNIEQILIKELKLN
jgi:hypothetical protein